MNKFKIALLTAAFVGLFACTTTQQPKKTVKTRYLKNNISQAELNHVENRTLNARGNRFEVIYRSYEPIDGSYVDLIARENNSVYYKNNQGMKTTWLNCREG